MTLYEINADIEQTILAMVDPETGEINEEAAIKLEELHMAKNEKVENIALWIKNLKSDRDQIKAEIKNLTERASSADKMIERLTRLLVVNVGEGNKFATPRVAISWRNSQKVNVTNEAELPAEYIRTKQEVDKVAIKNAIKAGEKVPGAEMVANTSMILK